MIGLIASLLPFMGLLAIVAVVVMRRGEPDTPDTGIGSVRRLVLYGLGFVALVFAAVGVALLLAGALDAAFGDAVLSERRSDLAVALAFATVGIPVWLILVGLAHRVMRGHPVERRSQARRWYMALVRGTALVIMMASALEVGRFLTGLEDFEGGPWGWLIAWALVWLMHDRLAAGEEAPDEATRLIDRLYLTFGAVLGLAFLLVGLVQLIEAPLVAAYDALFREQFVATDWSDGSREAAVVVVVGALAWTWHWLLAPRADDRDSTLRRAYVFLFGILPGVAMTAIAGGIVLHRLLEEAVGQPLDPSAVDHFAGLPGRLAVLVVGLATWLYHRAVVEELREDARHSEPERIYRYVVAAAGLVAIALAMATVIALLLDAATQDVELLRPSGWWRNELVIAASLLLVGAPLWGYQWYCTTRAVAGGGDAERSATSRRVYVFGVLGVAVLAVLIALIVVLFLGFEAALDARSFRDALRDARWGIAVFLSAGAVAVYHWLVLREDQAALADVEGGTHDLPRREVILLAPQGATDVAAALEAIPGVRVRRWRRLDGAPPVAVTADALARLRDEVAAVEAERVLVMNDGSGYRVVPFSN